MVSQIIATFYLNEFDHYIYYDLNCKHFGRYMDDIYIFHNDKDYLKQCLNIIVNKYKLSLNTKTKIYNNKDEID